MIIHVVEPGDSLYKIGQEYGVSPYRLAIDNGIEYNSTLVIGQTIVVQFPTVVHTVKQGESLYTIAKQYGVSVISLYQNNPQLNGRSTIMPGSSLSLLRPRKTWKF
ncbi:MAG: LysM peptidoglycan-binding domain-containing protein [Acutalibacteraceae bacterium]